MCKTPGPESVLGRYNLYWVLANLIKKDDKILLARAFPNAY
jgi:hypothetical protein